MPIYEFMCNDCGNVGEFLCLKAADQPKTRQCNKCGGVMRNIMSSPAVSKLAGAPPAGWQPLKKNKPKSYVPDPLG